MSDVVRNSINNYSSIRAFQRETTLAEQVEKKRKCNILSTVLGPIFYIFLVADVVNFLLQIYLQAAEVWIEENYENAKRYSKSFVTKGSLKAPTRE